MPISRIADWFRTVVSKVLPAEQMKPNSVQKLALQCDQRVIENAARGLYFLDKFFFSQYEPPAAKSQATPEIAGKYQLPEKFDNLDLHLHAHCKTSGCLGISNGHDSAFEASVVLARHILCNRKAALRRKRFDYWLRTLG